MGLTVTVFCQVCSALTYMHDQHLVHGLVSSHAIQLVAAGMAKLGNFEYTINRLAALVHCIYESCCCVTVIILGQIVAA